MGPFTSDGLNRGNSLLPHFALQTLDVTAIVTGTGRFNFASAAGASVVPLQPWHNAFLMETVSARHVLGITLELQLTYGTCARSILLFV
mmetsp:Transcript_25450/g.84179  ORF Transcript_25450/g.84179 Transcript_25450/m.84179 type:complete len:89 (+) Transcript_25450:116-382(+)